ncbi:MAG: T9SS type A sorting domain-containing protein, partial [Taibaiella sp.]|nr:T9SS type A sorting domain-containing protein [Taibaiella sp.]
INNDEHVLFDLSTTYAFNASVAGYENSKQRIQYFSNNKVSELVYKKWHDLSSSWKNAERYIYTYDNSGKMHSSLLQLWYGTLWTNDMNSVLNYDNNNNIVQMNSPTYTIDFVYDQNNNLVLIEDKILSQGGGWTNNERKRYKYNGTEVSEYVLEKWVNGSWVNISKWEYVHDAQSIVILATEYTWGISGWLQTIQEENVYDPDGNLLKSIEKTWNAATGTFVNNKMEERVYNNSDLPIMVTTWSWDGQNWIHGSNDIQVRYYYEVYFPASVNAITTLGDIKVFPVPATDVINVALQADKPLDIAVSLTDVTGKLVYTEEIRYTDGYNHAIPVSHLPTGNYALHISGQGVNIGRTVAVSH